jgi:hypothetical protein
MNKYLQQARNLGAHRAQQHFQEIEKAAADAADENQWGEGSRAGDILSPILGGLPLVGAPLAGYASGKTTPLSPGGVGAMTTAGSALGQAVGGLGGAGLGAGLGAGGAALANWLKPELQLDPKRAAILGALLGGGAGLVGGGMYGAHKGRQATEEAAKQEVMGDVIEQIQQRQRQAAENRAAMAAIREARQMGQMETLRRLQELQAQQAQPQGGQMGMFPGGEEEYGY